MLMGRGLFPKEAAAMVATWSDSWFEEGTRLFYVLTQDAVDAILPLRVTPRPAHTVRVFVGRLEVITPSLLQDVESAVRANDRHALARHARFLHPIYTLSLHDALPIRSEERRVGKVSYGSSIGIVGYNCGDIKFFFKHVSQRNDTLPG